VSLGPFDCGEKDQFNLLYGAPQVRAPAERARYCASLRGVSRQPHGGLTTGWMRACLISRKPCTAMSREEMLPRTCHGRAGGQYYLKAGIAYLSTFPPRFVHARILDKCWTVVGRTVF